MTGVIRSEGVWNLQQIAPQVGARGGPSVRSVASAMGQKRTSGRGFGMSAKCW
jgi:hypothetical protein